MNRFDIVEGYYTWLVDHHDGKGYPKQHPKYWSSYGRLSMMGTGTLRFQPRSNLSFETLEEDGRQVYLGLCRRGGFCSCPEMEKEVDGKVPEGAE